MSQAKVDQYKEEKKKRKENLAKAKRKNLMRKIFVPIIVLLILAVIGCGLYFLPKLSEEAKAKKQAEEMAALYESMGLNPDGTPIEVPEGESEATPADADAPTDTDENAADSTDNAADTDVNVDSSEDATESDTMTAPAE